MVLITYVERLDGNLLVEFSDGDTALYSSTFLYEHRERSGNYLIAPESDEDWYG
jgi:hypothetical protein